MLEQKAIVSARVAEIGLSAIKEMAMRAARVDGSVSLAWGLPSFRTPEPVRAAVVDALATDVDVGKYALPNGLPALRERVAETFAARAGRAVDPELEVLITAGNMQGMRALLRTVLELGDEVVMTDPGFVSHIQQVQIEGGTPVFWPLVEGEGWRLDLEALPALLSERTKAIILVNPSNPTGTLFEPEMMRSLARLAMERDILVIIDDPYSYIVHDPEAEVCHLAGDPGLSDHIAYLFTFSKIHAMSGWRLGYMVLPDWLRREVLKVHDANLICAPRPSQIAGLAALDNADGHIERFQQVLTARQRLICERLDRMPHLFSYVCPRGAYYVFPRIETVHDNSRTFAYDLLDTAGVSVTPGHAFGPHGEHHVRLAFCVDESTINEAFDRMERRYPA